MAKRPYFTMTLTLAAGASDTLPIVGKFLRCLEATGAFKIGFGDDGATGDFEKGLGIRLPEGEGYTRVRVENTVLGAPNTIRFAFSDESVDDSRAIFTSALQLAGSTLADTADVTVNAAATTAIVAANASRRSVLVGSKATNGGTVRIGTPGGVGAARGAELAPGASIELETVSAVSIHNPTGAACAFTVLELTN